MGILVLTVPFFAVAADTEAAPKHDAGPVFGELDDWLSLTGAERSDLRLVLPGAPLPVAVALAEDPLVAPLLALDALDAFDAEEPVQALARAWSELAFPVDMGAALPPSPPLEEQLLSRRDRAQLRKLDAAIVTEVGRIVAYAHVASTEGGQVARPMINPTS